MVSALTWEDLRLGPFSDENVGRNGRIQDVLVSQLTEHVDDRGRVFEFYPDQGEFWTQPVVWGHCFTILAGAAKGWGMHLEKHDRYCLIEGEVLTVLFDSRAGSATFGVVQEIHLSKGGDRMVRIPNGVWHLNVNLGKTEAMVIDLPTARYKHGAPDKITLPLNTDQIPFKWAASPWLKSLPLKRTTRP